MKTGRCLTIALFLGLGCFTASQGQESGKKLILLHTNDMHSRLNGFSPETEYSPLVVNNDNTIGGFARIAALIEEEKKKNSEEVLALDAGDFLMGTLFPILEKSTGFQLPLMKKMGYDMVTLGNHEFDFGPQALAKIVTASGENPIPLLVATNVGFSAEDPADDELKVLFDQGIIKPYQIIEKNGLKLGIIGILGYNAIHDSPLARPLVFSDPVKTARKYAQILREKEKVDLVICLSHSGVSRDKNGSWSGEDVKLAQQVPDIDLIISGHTHTLLEKPIMVNGIPIVQTGSYGTGLGRLELEITNGKITRIDSRVIPVTDAISGNPEIQQMIAARQEKITQAILKPLQLTYSTVVTETSFSLICDEDTLLDKSNLGPLISDALYSYINVNHNPGTDITLFPAGMIRDNIVPGKTGKQSVADLFRVVSLGSGKDEIPGYPLARVYVSGKELKGIMEILYLAPSSSPDNYIYFGGLRATYNPEKGLLRKITSIETGDEAKGFKAVDRSKKNTTLYSITSNTYMLEFVGIIKKLSKGLVKVTLKDASGKPIRSVADAVIDADLEIPGIQEIKEWMALLWYLQQQPDTNGNGIADIPDRYRTGSPRLHKE